MNCLPEYTSLCGLVFLTVGPHDRAYTVREEPGEYAAEHKTPQPTDA